MRLSSAQQPRGVSSFLAGALMCLATACGSVVAQSLTEDCGAAAWSLDADRVRLATPGLAELQAGATIDLAPGPAVELVLAPQAGGPDGAAVFGGVFPLVVPEPEQIWQITVSVPAWIDVRVSGHTLDPLAFTGVHACPGVRKSLRFRLQPGTAVLEVSKAATQKLRLVAAPTQ